MLFQIDEQLDELIVKVLAHRANLSAEEIRTDVLERTKKRFSPQAVYKELSKLQEHGVVVRLKQRYNLALSWALRFVTLGDYIYDVYLASAPVDLIMAEKTTKKSWRCSDFDKVANFWMQAKIAMLRQSNAKVIAEWLPYPWVELAYITKAKQFASVLRREKCSVYTIVGGDTRFAQELTKDWDEKVFTTSHRVGPFHELEHTYFSVIGDYIFTVDLTPAHHHELAEFFGHSRKSPLLRPETVKEFFRKKAKFRVKLEENSAKSKKLRRQFEDFFGVSFDRQ